MAQEDKGDGVPAVSRGALKHIHRRCTTLRLRFCLGATPRRMRRMHRLLLTLVALIFVSCSERKAPAPPVRHTYLVTFAAVLLPNAILTDFGGSYSAEERGFYFEEPAQRSKLARHLLQTPKKYPFIRQEADWALQVITGGDARMEMRPEAAKTAFSLEKDGMTLDRFAPSISVSSENEVGQISCSWACIWSATFKEPINGINQRNGTRPGGAVLRSGHPDMTPLSNFGDKTLWMIVGLDRQ